jgi:hypothetical protein
LNQLLINSKQKIKKVLVLSLILGLTQISAPASAEVASADATLSAFSFVTGDEVTSDGVITGTGPARDIAVEVPFGTDVTALEATFTKGDSLSTVEVDGVLQDSGTTPNDFSDPVEYVVTAEDGETTITYTVTVSIAAPSADATLSAFSFVTGDEVTSDGVITGTGPARDIAVEVPFGTDVTALEATFTKGDSLSTVEVDGVLQDSGTTPNDFSDPVEYVVTAEDGETTITYTVTVSIAAPSDFGFDESALSKVVGDGQFTRNATDTDPATGTGLITYSSGTPATATVNETTGEVTIVAAGTTIISATKAASAGFTATTKSYTLTVTAAPAVDGGSSGSSSSAPQSVITVNNPPTSSKWLKLTNNVLKVNFASQNKGKTVKIYNNQNQKTVLVGFAKLDKFGNATLTLKKKVLPGSLFAMIDKKIKNVITVE